MSGTEYILELKDEGLDEQEQQELRQRIEDEFDITFENPEDRAELAEPVTLIAAYTAGATTISVLIQIYNTLQDEDELVRPEITHNGEGDIYFIDADYAIQIGVDVVEEEGGTAVAVMSHEEVMELQKMKEKVE
ncbi:hypothetical protein EGH22_00255 [Halomicroarcula sp. F28]|uniref:hypothetical protein n=1 Tax=Haloarcula salinisoli TaxID=2487746 RepID=UPI001C736EA9|nr:hypothetical protein [Halomicroarcula salinisoli]MBX0284748.1 hypothetical protein [Halomicroarcula salinisoli]